MARIRIFVQQSLRTREQTVFDTQGNLIRVPFLRLSGLLMLGERTRLFTDSLIDTGAPLTIIPQAQWKRFEHDIEWLVLPPAAVQISWLTNVSGWAGGARRCRAGRVSMTALDLGPPRLDLPPVQAIALFAEDSQADDRIVVGLHAGILESRRLIVESDLRQAWLEERDPSAGIQ